MRRIRGESGRLRLFALVERACAETGFLAVGAVPGVVLLVEVVRVDGLVVLAFVPLVLAPAVDDWPDEEGTGEDWPDDD
jgi:hypothetical protein